MFILYDVSDKIWDVCDMVCLGCEMFGMWNVWDVECSGWGMFGMWNDWDKRYLECGMFRMWVFLNVGRS